MSEIIRDNIAEALEAQGLWRRAATRWLEVMCWVGHTDKQRDWLHQRRRYCLSRVAPIFVPEMTGFIAVARAANITQIRMGIAQPGGIAFRLKS